MYIASESYNNIAKSTGEVIRQNRKRIFHFFETVTKISEKISRWCSAYSFVTIERNKLIALDKKLEQYVDELLNYNNLKKTDQNISILNILGIPDFLKQLDKS